MTSAPNDHPATIYDVAAAAGVSPSTVSRTFSRPGRVSVRTADHIRAVAAEMGYREDGVFRPLAPAHHQTIGLAVSDISNPFYFGIMRGAEAQASKAGYTMLLVDSQESATQERDNMDRVLPLVDGLVVASSRMPDSALRSVAKSCPVVMLNRYVGGLPSVTPDTAHGMKQAIAHLLQLGHTSVHYVAGPDTAWISGMRWVSVRSAAASMGLAVHRIGPVPGTIDGGAAAAAQVTSRGATAVICYNDLIAIGLMRALKQRGSSIPEDISVIGCDNIFCSDMVSPPLTTVAAPMGILGDTAVKHILSMLGGGKHQLSAPITVPVKLMVRGSTGPSPAHARNRGGSGPSGPAATP